MGETLEKLAKILPHWEEHLKEHAEELETWAERLEEEGEAKLARKLKEAALELAAARLKLAEAKNLKEGSLAEELALCAVCAWRETCQKRFSRDTGSPIRCPDFTRDVTLKA